MKSRGEASCALRMLQGSGSEMSHNFEFGLPRNQEGKKREEQSKFQDVYNSKIPNQFSLSQVFSSNEVWQNRFLIGPNKKGHGREQLKTLFLILQIIETFVQCISIKTVIKLFISFKISLDQLRTFRMIQNNIFQIMSQGMRWKQSVEVAC